jgi:D-alanyl-D-alanine carboxypeptidase
LQNLVVIVPLIRFLLCLAILLLPVDAMGQSANPEKPKEDANKTVVKKAPIRGPSILIDARTGDVLAEDRAGEPWYPASLTKLMTGYIVFHKMRTGKLSPQQQIIVSERAAKQEPSKIGIPAGKTVSVDFALQAMLVYSANDMAYVLAEAASGSIENFAVEMNETARRLGLSATHFVNPNGLFDPRQITSARDMSVLAALIIAEFPEHQNYFIQQHVAVGKRKLANRNSLVRTWVEADGMKTGFVCNSGFNLVASATRDGRRLIAVVMGMRNSQQRAEAAKALLEQGFVQPPLASATKVAEVVNLPQGAIVPSDMTTTVCPKKAPVAIGTGAALAQWGISFGTYETAVKADMALRGRLLAPVAVDTRADVGVIKLPDKTGFAAMMWGLDQETTLKLCGAFRVDGAHCDVMTPDLLEAIAVLVRPKEDPKVDEPQTGGPEVGDDVGKPEDDPNETEENRE